MATASIADDRLGRFCFVFVLAPAGFPSSHHCLFCFVGRKQDVKSRPTPVFHPLGHNHKHHPSIDRLRSRPSHHHVGKEESDIAGLWIPSLSALTDESAVQLDISIRTPFLHHHFTRVTRSIIRLRLSNRNDSKLDNYTTKYSQRYRETNRKNANPLRPQPPPQKQHAEQHERSLLPAPLSQHHPLPLPQPRRARPSLTAGSRLDFCDGCVAG